MPARRRLSSLTALAWEALARNRTAARWLVGIIGFELALTLAFGGSITKGYSNAQAGGFPLLVSMLHMHLAGASVLLLLAVFGCTEFNPQTGSTGFPQRLLFCRCRRSNWWRYRPPWAFWVLERFC